MPYTGELIALATVLCWTGSIQFFEAASQRVGPTPVNIIRLLVAFFLFSFLLLLRDGSLFPVHFPFQAWIYLGLSGVVGFFLGDIFLFKALVEIGPRVAMLIFSLSAPAVAIMGWLFLDETYSTQQWTGMVVTLLGVGIVVFERGSKVSPSSHLKVRNVTLKGVLFGCGAMLGQASGYVLSKVGMWTETGYLDAFAATQVRVIAALGCFLVFFTVTGRWGSVRIAMRDRVAVGFTTTGAVIGPFLGVSLSLLVLHYLTTGVGTAEGRIQR
jgi:drug/metabolite transporter (DMT)-like permease